MALKLSNTQQVVVDTLQAKQQPLVRIPGGFWTYAGCPVSGRGTPDWWVTWQTVRALESKGVLRRAHRADVPDWKDDRVLAAEEKK
jgi:hypothetical protein